MRARAPRSRVVRTPVSDSQGETMRSHLNTPSWSPARVAALVATAFLMTALSFSPQVARATTAAPLAGSVVGVGTGAGDQVDPHVSGDWVTYTDFSSGSGRIRYHNLVTGLDAAIPDADG